MFPWMCENGADAKYSIHLDDVNNQHPSKHMIYVSQDTHIRNANCACAKMLYYIYVYQHDKYWKILDKQNEKKGGSSVLTFNQSMFLQHC